MTLEEAKKQIQAQANAQWEEFKKTGSSLHQGFALGGEDALEILDEVDAEPVGNPDKMNLDNVIRNLESDEAVCRSHGEDDYFKGMADGYKLSIDALKWLSGNPDKLTLNELAKELRKLFGFGYLVAYGSELYGYRVRAYLFKPKYIPIGGFWFNATRGNDALLDISFSDLRVNLDLSEYKDADGNIDYSKCIVEVSDEA